MTATEPNAAGSLTVYGWSSLPWASNVDYAAGQTIANAVLAALDAEDDVCMSTMSATHVVVDVNGWFPAGEEPFSPVTPTRLVDTRDRPNAEVYLASSFRIVRAV